MGAFRDDREALRARIDVLEGELKRGDREAELREVSALREQVTEALGRVRQEESELASLTARLEELERRLGDDTAVVAEPVERKRLVVAAIVAAMAVAVVGYAAVITSFEKKAGSPVVAPIAPTTPTPPPAPVPEPPALEGDVPELPPRSEVAAAMRALQPEMEACGDERRVVVARVEFSSDGAVRSAKLDELSEASASAACFHGVLSRARVAPFERDAFTVSFPFRL